MPLLIMPNVGFPKFEFHTFSWLRMLQPGNDFVNAQQFGAPENQATLIEDCGVGQFYFSQAPVLPIGSSRLSQALLSRAQRASLHSGLDSILWRTTLEWK